MINTSRAITDWVAYFGLVFAVIMIVSAGYFFLTAGGDPYKISQAKSFVLRGCVGIGIIVLAKVIGALIVGVVRG